MIARNVRDCKVLQLNGLECMSRFPVSMPQFSSNHLITSTMAPIAVYTSHRPRVLLWRHLSQFYLIVTTHTIIPYIIYHYLPYYA